MFSTLFAATLAAVTPTGAEPPASAVATTRCTVQQVHLPAGKIGPTNVIKRCKLVNELARQDVTPATDRSTRRLRD